MTLRESRLALGWSQIEAGWYFGVDQRTVSDWERGRTRHGYPEAAQILTLIVACYGRRKAHLALAGCTPDGKPFPGLLTERLRRLNRHVYQRVA